MNKSFLKWAGNKYRVLQHILPEIQFPNQFIEPFIGSASVTLNVCADTYVINDFNNDLISLYSFILHDDSFIDDCENYFYNKNTEELYYSCREEFNTTDDKRLKAMLFVYLNRHCFNGLTRYNKSGQFNVPYGKYKSLYFPKKEMENFKTNLNQRSIQLFSGDFANPKIYTNLTEDTVVYFDPPYLPLTNTANFSDYATGGFSYDDQVRLKDLALDLQSQGVKVIISNHDTEVSRELYSSASRIHSFNVGRFIAAKGVSRQPVKEILAVFC
jgi:DNA adenine methylase